jgi:RNA polymerase sigma factor (sigma-70 family)
MSDDQRRDFRTLMRLALAGDEEAAQELYDTYVKYVLHGVRRRMWRRLRVKFDSQDFAQQVWASFFDDRRRLPEFKTPEDLIGYLQSMAEKKVILEGRRQRNQIHDVQREVPIDEPSAAASNHPVSRDPTPSAVAVFEEQFVRVALKQPSDQRRVAVLRAEGHTFREIAQQLNIDESTARKKMRLLKKGTPREQEEE